jgi:Resolvase, N terminal domain
MLKRQRPRPGGSRGRADNCVSWNRRSLQIPPSAIAITAGQEAHSSAPTEEQAGRPAPRACPGHSPGCHCAPTRIARLARSIGDLRTARAEGASLRATEQLIDTGTAGGKCFLDMFGLFAEFEPNLRRERQLEGIAKAKAAGVSPAHVNRRTGLADRSSVPPPAQPLCQPGVSIGQALPNGHAPSMNERDQLRSNGSTPEQRLQPVVIERVAGDHKGCGGGYADCEVFRENLPDYIHARKLPPSTHRGQLDIANATSLRAFSDDAMTPRRCCKSSTARCPPNPSESHPIAFRSRPHGDALQGPRVAARRAAAHHDAPTYNHAGSDLILVAGRNRVEAHKRSEHWISARIIRGDTPEIVRAVKLCEVEENLNRRKLSPALRKMYTVQLNVFYEEQHPETKAGKAGGLGKARKSAHPQSGTAPAFTMTPHSWSALRAGSNSNLYADMAFKNCSEVETQPKRICISKMVASWLLLGASLAIGSLVQSVSNTH